MNPFTECHLCAARFQDDNAMAEHMVRHRNATPNDRMTNHRQATHGQIEDLRDLLEELAQ